MGIPLMNNSYNFLPQTPPGTYMCSEGNISCGGCPQDTVIGDSVTPQSMGGPIRQKGVEPMETINLSPNDVMHNLMPNTDMVDDKESKEVKSSYRANSTCARYNPSYTHCIAGHNPNTGDCCSLHNATSGQCDDTVPIKTDPGASVVGQVKRYEGWRGWVNNVVTFFREVTTAVK